VALKSFAVHVMVGDQTMPSVLNALRCVAAVLTVSLCGCAARESGVPRASAKVAVPAATLAPRSSTFEHKPFSGEIVYRMTAKAPLATKDLGELHYFISGAHWKHVDQDGATRAIYDPDTHLIHYFKPEAKVVDASRSDGSATFVTLSDTRVVLGRTCKGIQWTTSDRKVTGYYDPELFVDPAPFTNHHFGHWAETLAQTGGALILWSDMEFAQGDIISDPISIRAREFDASFWALPQPTPPPANPGG